MHSQITFSPPKPKLAVYWCASCGGCEVSLVNTDEFLLEIDLFFDFIFCPCLLDAKKRDIELLPDNSIFITLLNGSLRTEENLEMAELLRQKSQFVVAFGSCAATGGIPALGNHHGNGHLLKTVFGEIERTENTPPTVKPLPKLLPRVYALHEKIKIDATVPGCPPEPSEIIKMIRFFMAESEPDIENINILNNRSLCHECPREKRGVLAARLVRSFEIIPESGWCLLEQGIPCVGSSIRAGCGALCPAANMPCTGCYGALDTDSDPGASATVALTSATNPIELKSGSSEAVVDPLGTLYRYNLSESLLSDRKPEGTP